MAIHPQGRDVLIGHKLRQIIPGRGVKWCWPVRQDQNRTGYIVQHEDYSEYPFPVPFNYLGVGLGEREPTDPLILLLQQKGQDVAPFLIRQAPAPTPLQVPAAMARTPGVGFQSPLPMLGADPIEQNQAFQNVVLNIVQQGSLNDLMDSIIVNYGTRITFRAWRSKAKYLMAIYREGDR